MRETYLGVLALVTAFHWKHWKDRFLGRCEMGDA
jgi:hypothetical protein